MQEESPVAYDSPSNGCVEVGINILRGMYAGHPIMAWLFLHTCTLINAGSVERTARRHGKE